MSKPKKQNKSMKIEIETSDLEKIAEMVIERIKPLLANSHDSTHSELITVKEVARYIKEKESTIYKKVHQRTIPFLKTGGSSRFRKKHIDIWLHNPYHSDLDIYKLNHNGRG